MVNCDVSFYSHCSENYGPHKKMPCEKALEMVLKNESSDSPCGVSNAVIQKHLSNRTHIDQYECLSVKQFHCITQCSSDKATRIDSLSRFKQARCMKKCVENDGNIKMKSYKLNGLIDSRRRFVFYEPGKT